MCSWEWVLPHGTKICQVYSVSSASGSLQAGIQVDAFFLIMLLFLQEDAGLLVDDEDAPPLSPAPKKACCALSSRFDKAYSRVEVKMSPRPEKARCPSTAGH